MSARKGNLAETARRNRVELIEAGFTRRDLVRMGLITAAGWLVAKVGLSARASHAGDRGLESPPTTPWIEELPIPPVAEPGGASVLGAMAPRRAPNRAAGEGGRTAEHQHWALYDPANADHYRLESRPAPHTWHRELPADELWAFNGLFPGPRIHARQWKFRSIQRIPRA